MASQIFPGGLAEMLRSIPYREFIGTSGSTAVVGDAMPDYRITHISITSDGTFYTMSPTGGDSTSANWQDIEPVVPPHEIEHIPSVSPSLLSSWTSVRTTFDPYNPTQDELDELRAELARLRAELEKVKPAAKPVPFARRPGERRFG